MSLKVWLPLDGDLRNLGTSDIEFTNENTSNIVIDTAGKIGKCYKRTAAKTTGRIIANKTINLNNDLSICCWAKVTATVGNTANGLISLHSHEHNTGFGLTVKEISTTDYRICCSTGNGSNRTYSSYYGTTNIKDSWHHLTLTYNNTIKQFKLWVDGNLEYTQGYTNASRDETLMLFEWSTTYNEVNYRPACSLNDVRIYDHCLSAAEVHEIAQGLVLHYKLDDPRQNCYTNLAPTPINDHGSYSTPSHPWDTTKHQDAIIVHAWTDGYNGGVQEPTKGYHAMWKLIDNIPTAIFQNHNSEVGYANRWLGIASNELSYAIPAGMKYTLSYEQKTLDTLNSYTCGGIYYKTKSANGDSFYDGCPQIGKNTVLNKWEHFSKTFTRSSNMDDTGTAGRIYIYGDYSPESTILIRNIKLEIETYNSSFWDSVNKNIFSSFSAGGRTTLNNNIIKTTGENADTYFYINTTTPLISGKNYTLQIYCNGLPTDGYWIFGAGSQSSTNNSHIAFWRFENGLNTYNFTCPSGLNNQTRFILDDNGRPNYSSQTNFYNAKLFENTIDTIVDSSGYGHNGEIISELYISNDTARYNNSTLFDGVDDCIIVPYNEVCPENIFTINLWFKKDALGSKNYETLFGGPSGFEMDTRAGSATSLSLYMASTRNGNRATGITMNEWHMITMTRDGTTEKYYVDGEFKSEIEAKSMPNGVYRIGAWASNTGQNYYGLINDFRIYCTPLLDTDIKLLYNLGMRVDNLGGIHTFEFLENEEKESIKNTGQIITTTLDESHNIAQQSKNYGWFSPNFIEI